MSRAESSFSTAELITDDGSFSLDNIPELTPVLLCNGLVNPHAVHLVSLGEFVKVHRLQLQPVTAH